MFTEHQMFNYEQPTMTYDKETGDVTIHDPMEEKNKKKPIIKSVDEVTAAKKALFEELGLDNDGFPIDKKPSEVNTDDLAQSYIQLDETMKNQNWTMDPSQFYATSLDHMRIDVGLFIMRPPIFLHLRDEGMDFMKFRQELMEEYGCNTKQFLSEYREVVKLNEDILA